LSTSSPPAPSGAAARLPRELRSRQWTTNAAGDPPRVLRYLDPLACARALWVQRGLVTQFTRREIEGRYRGSALGLLWTLINPLTLLATYTLVFGGVFKARWPEARGAGLTEFALALFCGLVAYNLLNECVSRAPLLIIAVPNYVRKVVFPLEVLPLSVLGSSLFHALASLAVLLAVRVATGGTLAWTLLLLPLVALPLLFVSLGLSWFLAGLGVYLRDIGYVTGLVMQVLLFATPIFYPSSALPPWVVSLIRVNPLVDVVENLRRVLLWGRTPEWIPLAAWIAITGAVLLLGYAWFMQTKRGFPDVL
jgi:lipopolysaccharide transport system permease protein